jgi:hypothetical protein
MRVGLAIAYRDPETDIRDAVSADSLSQQPARDCESLCFRMRWLGVRSNSSTIAM